MNPVKSNASQKSYKVVVQIAQLVNRKWKSVGGYAVKQTWHFSHDLWADVVRERKGMFVQTQALMALIGLRSRGRRRIVQIIERLEACDEHENEARNKT